MFFTSAPPQLLFPVCRLSSLKEDGMGGRHGMMAHGCPRPKGTKQEPKPRPGVSNTPPMYPRGLAQRPEPPAGITVNLEMDRSGTTAATLPAKTVSWKGTGSLRFSTGVAR